MANSAESMGAYFHVSSQQELNPLGIWGCLRLELFSVLKHKEVKTLEYSSDLEVKVFRHVSLMIFLSQALTLKLMCGGSRS